MVVSIVCNVYNHAPFLRQCLDGLIMQKTDFPFEILIHDDASTDDSAQIIREYETAYPDLIFPIYQTQNQYSQGVPIEASFQYPRAKGKYIALCEGDDYWTDPLKLQKQIDYLESHPDCSLCFTNAWMKWEDHSRPDKLFAELIDKDYSGIDITNDWIIPTTSAVFRKEVVSSELYKKVSNNTVISIVGDTPLFLTCAQFGRIHALSEATCVYRRHQNGFLLNADSKRRLRLGDYRLEIFKVFGTDYKRISVLSALPHYRMGLRNAKYDKDYFTAAIIIERIIKVYLTHPFICCSRIKLILKEKF